MMNVSESKANNDALQDELTVIQAIFGEDCSVSDDLRCATVWVPGKDKEPRIKLTLSYPCSYPSSSPPIIELSCPHISEAQHEQISQELEDLFLPGEEVTFNMIDLLKERLLPEGLLEDAAPSNNTTIEDQAAGQPDVASRKLSDRQEQAVVVSIQSGLPYTERKSTFQAHVAGVQTLDEVEAMVFTLKRNSKIARATHNMLAYRIATQKAGTFLQDYDDDGETAAGRRMLHLLQMADVQNVCVVVSRWFGGVRLGPSRFAIINNTARQLLVQEGFMPSGTTKCKSRK